MKKHLKTNLILFIILIILGQIVFYVYSPNYTKTEYVGKIFATTGVKHDASDLHNLNESAHYFGETMIGWTKFPHFQSNLITRALLPEGTEFSASIQERQNMIYTIRASEPLSEDSLRMTKEYIQEKINKYNQDTNTQFLLSNVDYDSYETSGCYGLGAIISLIISLVLGMGLLIIKKEFCTLK